jgi:hypothetical protein
MKYDLKDLAASSPSGTDFQPLPEDRYNLEVDKAEYKQSAKGTWYLDVAFIVMDGPYAKRKVWNIYSLTDKAISFLTRFLKAAGNPVLEQNGVDGHTIAASMVGNRASYMVSPGVTSNGSPKSEIDPKTVVAISTGAPAVKTAPAAATAPHTNSALFA